MLFCALIIFSVLAGHSLGDLITSHGSDKQAEDGNSVTLSCNYSGVVYNLLWYRQYQRSKPELLLYMTESGNPVKADPSAHWLSAKVDKNRKLMELEISPAKASYSARYKDYSGTVNNLFWYRQYPRSKPEFLLYILPQGFMSDERPPRFSAEVNQSNKQVDLIISSVVETDSAIYYCALVPTVTGNLTMLFLFLINISLLKENADAINPLVPEKHVTAGDNVTLTCDYNGRVNTLQWYRRYPGSRIEFLIFATELNGRSKPELRLSSVAYEHNKSMHLSIFQTEIIDSALYYCALVPTVMFFVDVYWFYRGKHNKILVTE
ncbi:hypothetical protein QQF64_015156 [Cirrhinus molitorella]|uniref:Ig-like domain-containing protein n=1 Tax=Cirrhinus molitorella TaxID=172907 RepID=A0ABR3NU57_9TELE